MVLEDLAVAVKGPNGVKVLVYESPRGALSSNPETFYLQVPAAGLVLQDMNNDSFMDLTIGAGRELLIVSGRDRQSSFRKGPGARGNVAIVGSQVLPFTIASLVGGNFTASPGEEFALLGDDGAIHVISRVVKEIQNPIADWKRDVLTAGAFSGSAQLIRARVATSFMDDLLIADRDNKQLSVVISESRIESAKIEERNVGFKTIVPLDASPIAVLPMRLNADAISDLVILKSNSNTPVLVLSPQLTFTVSNTNDTGSGSFREAITLANSNPGPDLIDFNILPGGPQTITPISALPTITDPITIDGTTQPGFVGIPIIELNGSSVPPGTNGLLITGGSSTVRGLVINRFAGSGDAIEVQTNGGNIVEGNFIGTDLTGTLALPNGNAVFINGPPNNTVGGTTSAARNLISGNSRGITVVGIGATGNFVRGNFIGTNVAGNADLGNAFNGVDVSQGVTTIGGTVAGARNIISGNNNNGIAFSATSGNLVQGNLIGTDVNGTLDLGNSQAGAQVSGGSANNSFGGTTPAARNIVSGNGTNGIRIRELGTTGNVVQGNFIGTQINGTSPLGNSASGVLVENLASNNSIGGTASGAGNIIAFNGDDGVTILGDPGNDIRANSIFSNAQLGIDLGSNGVTLNDFCDGDQGANNLQNFPIILGSGHTATTITVQGILNSTPNTIFSLDFFANSICDPLGFGEGATYLGTATVRTDADCGANFLVTFNAVVSTGQVITASATDPVGNTSEFSSCSAPTAAPASISGQITTVNGRPVGGVIVKLTGGVQERRAITNGEGNYAFTNVDTHHFYSVSPERANYLFSPGERSFTLLANKTDAVFAALPVFETANPLDLPEFFVRQNYLDFLGREPDEGGLEYWSREIHWCNGDEQCISARRIAVSAAFFIEEEFQQTGNFVYRLYKGSLERQPSYAEFTADRERVRQAGTLDERRAAFVEDWVGRAVFKQRYPEAMTVAEFVNRLFDSAALVPYTDERRQQIAAMRTGKTRAQVLREVIEIADFRSREYNPSFVLMEYFGYLGRDPDREGYDFWLNTLNNRDPGNYRGMVCAFITSREYQQRFSSVVTRANSDCEH
jgi:hypothetical protein